MTERQQHTERMARLHEQLGAIQGDQRATDRIRAERARQAVWRDALAAAEQQNAVLDRALDQQRAAGRQVFGTFQHIDRETGR